MAEIVTAESERPHGGEAASRKSIGLAAPSAPPATTIRATTATSTDGFSDTIAAIATPPGVGAVAIIRLSGSAARAYAAACFSFSRGDPDIWPAARMRRGSIVEPTSGTPLDDALAVGFWSPHSYTGEDVVELHVHGGAGVAQACLQAVI